MSFRMHDYYQNYRIRDTLDHKGGNIYGNCNVVDGDYYINGSLLLPTGMIIQHISDEAPYGWLVCDGRDVSINEYPRLYEVIGTRFGVSADPNIHFRLPNFRGRVPVGYDATRNDREIADISGAETHTLTEAEMPSHTHAGTTDSDGAHTHTYTDTGHTHQFNMVEKDDGNFSNQIGQYPVGDANKLNGDDHYVNTQSSTTGITINSAGEHTHTFTTQSTGGGQPHNNMQPYLVVNYLIRW